MTNRETQKMILEKYIDSIAQDIGKAIRERRPFAEIAEMQTDSNSAVLRLEALGYALEETNNGNHS
jgi:hypothetical protein